MPVTPAHIAAVLPLRRTRLNFEALVIGSISPDLSYVVEMLGLNIDAHSFAGVFLFCLPASMALWWCYQPRLREEWRPLFPWLGDGGTPTSLVVVALSCLIGATTHFAWDSFTHPWGWPVHQNPWLSAEVFTFMGRSIQGYRVAQQLSSLIGLTFVCRSFSREVRSKGGRIATSPRELARIASITLAVAFLLCTPLLLNPMHPQRIRGFEVFFGRLAFRMMGAVLIVGILYPFGAKRIRRAA